MKRGVFLLIVHICIFFSIYGQDAKFGGPYSTTSYNKHGLSLSAGGGGTFYIIKNFYIGIFGQGTTDAFKRNGSKGYLLKSRQTGFWIGYKNEFKNFNKLSMSFYNKVGFGQVQLNNPQESITFYDKSIIFTPNVEFAYRFSKSFEIGLAIYYEIFTNVSLFQYSSSDFNSIGASLLFKFKKSD
jgi:hypothetical protein